MKRYPELINQVVTKRLDPNVEMKPSGVDWGDTGALGSEKKQRHLQ